MKYNKSEIMKAAWSLYKMSRKWVTSLDFAECLRRAWKKAKQAIKDAAEALRTGLRRMHYSEYKNNYTHCKTVEGSYDKRTKTIEVMTKIARNGVRIEASGICPHCGTYCYGDCMAH